MLEGTEYDEYLKEQEISRANCLSSIKSVHHHLNAAMHFMQETGDYESNLLDDACSDIKDAIKKVKLELEK